MKSLYALRRHCLAVGLPFGLALQAPLVEPAAAQLLPPTVSSTTSTAESGGREQGCVTATRTSQPGGRWIKLEFTFVSRCNATVYLMTRVQDFRTTGIGIAPQFIPIRPGETVRHPQLDIVYEPSKITRMRYWLVQHADRTKALDLRACDTNSRIRGPVCPPAVDVLP